MTPAQRLVQRRENEKWFSLSARREVFSQPGFGGRPNVAGRSEARALSLLVASDEVITPWVCWRWGILLAIQVAADGIPRDVSPSLVVLDGQVQADCQGATITDIANAPKRAGRALPDL